MKATISRMLFVSSTIRILFATIRIIGLPRPSSTHKRTRRTVRHAESFHGRAHRNLLDPLEGPPLDSRPEMSGSGNVLRTPLYGAHVKLKARMVDFHGWEM